MEMAMNAFLFPAGRRRISAHNSGDYRHDYACDTQPPNRAAHRRGFFIILIVIALAACVALIGGVLQGFSDMGAAFPSGSALFEAASWDKFFAGFGRVAALIFFLTAVVLVARRRRRKAKRIAPPEK
jgi:preprotein translocase subunit SecG